MIVLVIFNVFLVLALSLRPSASPGPPNPRALNSDLIRVLPTPRNIAVPSRCLELGPFNVQETVSARRMLDELSLSSRMSSVEIPVIAGWWVYIAPRATRAEALKRARDLEKLGVREHYVFDDSSPWKNAISLGLFKTESAAEKYLDDLGRKGVKGAKVGRQDQRVTHTVFYMTDPDAEVIARLTEVKAQFSNADLRQVSCPALRREARGAEF